MVNYDVKSVKLWLTMMSSQWSYG